MSKTFVFDGHLSSKTLLAGLKARDFDVVSLQELELEDELDPDVVTQANEKVEGDSWVLVTMDLTITEEHPRFDWNRYAIAWVKVPPDLRGSAVEAEKHNIVHKHIERMEGQQSGDHFTYTRQRFYRHPPSLISRPY